MTGLAAFKLTEDVARFRRLMPHALAHRVYRQLIWPNEVPKSAGDLWRGGIPVQSSFEAELEWTVQSLLVQSVKIAEFLQFKQTCERLYLMSESERLLGLLDEIEKKFGISLWLIEAKINAIQAASGLVAQREYASSILRDSSVPTIARYLVSWFSFRSEENLSAQEFERLVDSSISNKSQVYNLVRIVLGLQQSVESEHAAQAIAHIDGLTPVDRYFYLISIIQAVISLEDSTDQAIILNAIKPLSGRIPDTQLLRLVSVLSGIERKEKHRLIPALDAYCEGDYETAIIKATNLAREEASVDALIIAVRVEAVNNNYFEFSESPASLFGRIAADLSAVTAASDAASEAEARLAKIRTSSPNASWASSIDLFLRRQRRDERIHQPTPQQTFAALRATEENPFLAYCMPGSLGPAYLVSTFSQHTSSPALREAQSLSNDAGRAPAEVSDARAARIGAISALRAGDQDRAEHLLQDFLTHEASSIEKLEANLMLVEVLLRKRQLEEACGVSVNLILESAYLARRLPLERIVTALAEWDQDAERSDRVLGRLSIVLLIYLYGRYIAADFEELGNDAFLDFLDREGVEKPSDLDAARFSNDNWLVYFFHHASAPDALDQCFALRSTRDVEDERARIIVRCVDMYAETQKPGPPTLQDELQQIRTKQVIRDTSFKLDQSKIFVDVDGIQSSLGTAMRENWNRYRLIGLQQGTEGGLNELVKGLEDALGRKLALVSVSLPITERNKLFERMFREIRDQFATSKLFGLDANLSTNVRHGYILRELRGPFVAASLVTNLISTESGYRPNKYWLDRMFSDGSDSRQEFQEVLDRFSARVDEEIERLTRRRIRIFSDANPDGLFNFAVSDIDLQLLQSRVEGIETYEEFLKSTFEVLWVITDLGLNRVKQCLHNETLLTFNTALDELQGEADCLLTSEQSSAFEQAISLVRPEVSAAVERVSSWFALSTSHEYQDYPLQIAFDVGLATVTSYFSHLDIQASIRGAKEIMMAGWTLPSFARLFLLLMENAALHAGIAEGKLVVDAAASINSDFLEITISNQLADSIDRNDLELTIQGLNKNFGSEAAENSVGTERGSGYPKIWKILRHDLRRDYAIDVKLSDDSEFRVDIYLNKDKVVV